MEFDGLVRRGFLRPVRVPRAAFALTEAGAEALRGFAASGRTTPRPPPAVNACCSQGRRARGIAASPRSVNAAIGSTCPTSR